MAAPVADINLQRPDFNTFLKQIPIPDLDASTFPDPNQTLEAKILDTGAVGSGGGKASANTSNDPFASVAAVVGKTPKGAFDINSSVNVPVTEIDTSGRFKFFSLGVNNEDAAAAGQSGLAKASNAVLKGLVLTGTTFLQGTVGLVAGVGKAIATGKMSGFYDNGFNRALTGFNDVLDKNYLPNYYSQAETDAKWYSPDNWMTVNFLFDKVVKNLGFAAGAYLSGGVYSKALSALGSLSKVTSIGKSFEAAAAAEKALAASGNSLEKITQLQGALTDISANAIQKYNILSTGQRVLSAGLSTVGEASFESLTNANTAREASIQTFRDRVGRLPTGEEMRLIDAKAADVGKASFLLNTALLTVTNYIQFPKILGTSYKASKSIANDFAVTTNQLVKDTESGLIREIKFPKLYKGAKTALEYSFAPSEAIEEVSQTAIQFGTQNYYDKKYRGSDTDFMSDLVGAGYSKAFNTKEGWESLIIGGVSGAISQVKGTFNKNKALKSNTAQAIQALNDNTIGKSFSGFMQETLDGVNRGITLQEQQEAAIRQGDIVEAKDLERDYAHNYLNPRIKYGRYDLVKDDIQTMKTLASTDKGFAQLQAEGKAAETDTKGSFLARLDNFEKHADNMKTFYESFNLRYKGLVNADKSRVYSDNIIDKMVYAASKVEDYNQRIPAVMSYLTNSGINTLALNSFDVQDYTGEAYKDLREAIGKLPLIDATKEALEQDLNDFVEMGMRRKYFLDEFGELKNNPVSFREPEETTAAGAVPPENGIVPPTTATITTADGEENVQVGEEYYLGRVVKYDKNGKEVYRFPRLTILGTNSDGSIKIKQADGKIRDVPADEFKGYKLGKVSDVARNKKAKFYLEHINDIFTFNFGKKGGKQRGRLQFNAAKNKMEFVYVDKKGKLKRIEVTGDQFLPKKGFSVPLIQKIGTLTPVQQTALEEMAAAKDDDRVNKKREARLALIGQLVTDHRARIDTVNKRIDENNKSLLESEGQLAKLSDKITKGEIDEEKQKFKPTTRQAVRTAMKLSRMRDEWVTENTSLESERDQLEMNLAYFDDVAADIDNLPTDSTEFLEEIKEQAEDVLDLIVKTGDSINKATKLIGDLEKAIDSSIDFIHSLIGGFTATYPKAPTDSMSPELVTFFRANPNFLKLNPNFLEELKTLENFITEAEDKDIRPSEAKLAQLRADLDTAQKSLKDMEVEYKAKSAVYDKFELVIIQSRADKKAQAEFEANKAIHDKLFQSQKELEPESGDPAAETGVRDIRPPAKDIEILFRSNTSPDKDHKPHHIREQFLLNNAKWFKNPEELRVVLVTRKTEASMGLPGLITRMGGDDNTIATVYARAGVDGKPIWIDSEGNPITETDPQAILDKAAYSTMPTDSLMIPSKPTELRYGKGTPEDAIAHQAAWKQKRAEILAWTDGTFQAFEFNISRGIAKKNIKEVDKKNVYEENNIVGALIKQSDLFKQGLVRVVTTGVIDHQDTSVTFPPGSVVIQNGDTLEFANNRQFTDKEVDTLYKALRGLVSSGKQGTLDKRFTRFLQGVFYFSQPESPAKAGRNQIWIQEGRMHLGKNFSFPFYEGGFDRAKPEVVAWLKGSFNNVNNTKLKDNKPYNEIIDVKDGEPVMITWKSYQHFLLSPTYDLIEDDDSPLKGKAREKAPLSTSIRTINTAVDPLDSNFEQKYATLVGEFYPKPEKLEPKKESTPPAPKKEAVKKEPTQTPTQKKATTKYITDGITQNILPTKGGDVPFTAVLGPQGYIIGTEVSPAVKASLLANPNVGAYMEQGLADDEAVEAFLRDYIAATIIKSEQEQAPSAQESTPAPSTPVVTAPVQEAATLTKAQELIAKAKASGAVAKKDADYRLFIEPGDYIQANLDQEQSWFEKNFSIPFKRVKNIINAGGAGLAFGKFQNAAVYIWENAETGTTYHEAFEAVWSMFTDLKEKNNILGEFRARKGSYKDRETGATLSFSNSTDQQAKEQIAEEFRDFVIKAEKPQKGFLQRMFTDLLNFIKGLFQTGSPMQAMFRRINGGYYKTAVPINHENIGDPQYRIDPNWRSAIAQTVTKHVTVSLLRQINKDGSSAHLVELDEKGGVGFSKLFSMVYDEMQDWYEVQLPLRNPNISPEEFAKYLTVWENVKNNWDSVKENALESLRTYGIIAKMNELDTDEIDDTENIGVTEEKADGKSSAEYERDHFAYDIKKNAPASIKFLFANLTEAVGSINGEYTLDRDKATSLEKQTQYTKVFNQVMTAVSTGNTMDEKKEILRDLMVKYPTLRKLYSYLKFDKDNISVDDWRLRVRFFNVFSKQQPSPIINYVNEMGEVFVGDADLSNAAQSQVRKWVESFKATAGKTGSLITIGITNKEYLVKKDALDKYNISKLSDKVKMLNDMGIAFTEAMYNLLSTKQRSDFNKAVAGLKSALGKKDKLIASSAKTLDISGSLTQIAEAFLRAKGEEWESTFINIEGEKVQKHVLVNFVSNIVNDFNNATDLDDLYRRVPHLKYHGYSAGSQYLKDINDPDKRTSFKVKYIQGTIDQSKTYKPNIPTEKLSPSDRLIQEINQNLVGNYYVLVPADSKTEWMLGMDNKIDFSALENKSVMWKTVGRIFNEYYQVEKALFKADGKPRLLAAASNNYKSADISEGIKKYIEQQVDDQLKFLLNNGKNITHLNSDFVLDNFGTTVSDDALREALLFTTINYVINNTEIHKIFFGDPAAYKDPTKRFKSFLSPREASLYGSPEWNNITNEEANKVGDIKLTAKDYGYWQFHDVMAVATVDDIITSTSSDFSKMPENIREAYQSSNSADGQSWGTMTGYREIWKRSGDRWTNAHETQFQYMMARDRQEMLKDGVLTNSTYRKELQEVDKARVAKGNPRVAFFPVLKPIGSGFDGENLPFLHKTSLVPLWYTGTKVNGQATNLTNHYLRMVDNGISYSIVASGQKVGTTDKDSVFDETGKAKPNDDFFDGIIEVPFRYYGIQVETNTNKDKGPRGTQITKEVTMNLMDDGIPIDHVEGQESKIGKEIAYNKQLLDKITNIGYQKLLDKFGLIDDGTSFSMPDKTKVFTLLRDEMFRREMPDNLRNALKLNEAGEFAIALEALPNYGQIKSILYSYVDKYISKPKVNGGAKVQVSGAMWEKAGAREVTYYTEKGVKKTAVVSRGLKFYEPVYDSAGKLTAVGRMEVMLPNWVGKKLRRTGMTDEEIIAKMTPEMLRGVGFRIPTQEINSMEAFIIKGFLPEEYGSTIIVPEEITTKAGSDFDVDKLNTYLKNIHVKKTGNLHLIEYQGTDESTLQYYREFYDKAIEEAIAFNKKKIANTGKNLALVMAYDSDFLTDEQIEENADYLDELLEGYATNEDFIKELEDRILKRQETIAKLTNKEIQDIAREMFAEGKLAQALENEYFNSVERLILLPQNFERLITPNSAQELKDLRDDILDIIPNEGAKDKNILNRLYVSQTRHNFIIGKGGVAIAAIAQTNHAVNQLSRIMVDPDKLEKLPKEEQEFLGDLSIKLPHNTTVDAKGRTVATLSKIKNTAGKTISNIVAQFIDGYVDIAKDPFIVELGANPNRAGTFLMLAKLGVPIDTVVYFMNQPIIREYQRVLGDYNYLFKADNIDLVKGMFATSATGITEINVKGLRSNIAEFYTNGKLSDAKNAEQQVILDEFLKYSMMSTHLLEFTQATNYDTANFSDPNLRDRKEKKTARAREQNIFSSPDTYMGNSHVGSITNATAKANDAIGTTLFKLRAPAVKAVLGRVVDIFDNAFMTEKSYIKTVRKIEEGFLSYLIQTKRGLNAELNRLLIDPNTNIATRITAAINDAKKNPNSDLANNAFLQNVAGVFGNNQNSTKNLALSIRVNGDTFTSGVITEGLAELKEYDIGLYGDVVRAAFLQSGISKTPFSYTDLIPADDYGLMINSLLTNLVDPTKYSSFADIDGFIRNNWRDTDIVPMIKEKHIKEDGRVTKSNRFRAVSVMDAIYQKAGIPKEESYHAYKVGVRGMNAKRKYLTVQRNKASIGFKERNAMAKKKDFSFLERVLVKRLDNEDGTPYILRNKNPKYDMVVYFPINAWGDGYSAQEYYNTPRQSLHDNGTYKPSAESTTEDIMAAMNGNLPGGTNSGGSVGTRVLAMHPDNIEKIKNGTVKTTIRTEKLANGVYNLSDQTQVGIKLVSQVRVGEKGIELGGGKFITFDVFAKREGFQNWKDFVANNKYSAKFVDKTESRYLYNIDPIKKECN